MKKEFEMLLGHDGGLSYYYQEWHISGELENFLTDWEGKRVKITVEVIEDATPEETVTVTYKELFNRAADSTLTELGVNIYYMNEGGDPTAIIDIPKSIARQFMCEDEFNGRKHDENS
jgi:hypothetical protein